MFDPSPREDDADEFARPCALIDACTACFRPSFDTTGELWTVTDEEPATTDADDDVRMEDEEEKELADPGDLTSSLRLRSLRGGDPSPIFVTVLVP